MGQSTSELRHEIEQTRTEMSGTIDALAERTSPKRVVGRGRERVRSGVIQRARGMRETVMGTAESVMGGAEGAAQGAQEQVRQRARGNPLAAGAIAFGGGVLAASLFRPTRTEQEMAGRLREEAQPAMDELRQAGEHVREEVTESARQSAEEVKTTAKESAEEVKTTAKDSAEELKTTAKDSAEEVRDKAPGGP